MSAEERREEMLIQLGAAMEQLEKEFQKIKAALRV